MRAAFLALLLPVLGCGGAAGQAVPVPPSCRSIADPGERLRCYDEDAAFDFSAVAAKELECVRAPRAGEVLKVMMRRNAVRSMAFEVGENANYFELSRPEKVDGLNVVAVFGFDETGHLPFVRGPGASRGTVFGLVTRDPMPAIDAWRLRHDPALAFDVSASRMKDAYDIACVRSAPPAASASAMPNPQGRPVQAPSPPPAKPRDDPFEAGLAPKRR